jgi:hypothetical protein
VACCNSSEHGATEIEVVERYEAVTNPKSNAAAKKSLETMMML